MGVTLHYSGKIKSVDHINPLIDEIVDLGKSLSWESQVIARYGDADEELLGVVLIPPESEPICLTFMEDLRLTPIIAFAFGEEHKIEELKKEKLYIFTKTQFAGSKIHIAVVKLLKYISNKYFSTFECIDEGGYWESGNEDVLQRKMDLINSGIDIISKELEKITILDNPSEKDILEILNSILGDMDTDGN